MTRLPFYIMSFLFAVYFGAYNINAASLAPVKAIPVEKVFVVSAASIAISQTVSAAITVNGLALVGIQMPAAFTGTAMTFQGSLDCSTYQAIYSTTSGTALSYTVAQGHFVAIDPVPFYGLKCIKLVSGSTEAAARSFSVSLKGL